MKALVTGGRGGIGSAICALLDDPVVLDLPEFDVGEPEAWRSLEGEFDAAFLNAGVLTGERDPAALGDEQYRRVVRTNVDGVVFGIRECAVRLMPGGGSIVVTASLAGLRDVSLDPVYALTKHAVVGFVRSVAPHLERRGLRINAICPGLVNTPMASEELRAAVGVELIDPSFVAEAALRVL